MDFTRIEIVLENCDVISIPKEHIDFMFATKINEGFVFTRDYTSTFKTAGKITLRLKPEANVVHHEHDVDDLETAVFDRLGNFRDIITIDLFNNEELVESYYVVWENDGNEVTNKLQKNKFNQDGTLEVVIGV